jgi:hypothetical protein
MPDSASPDGTAGPARANGSFPGQEGQQTPAEMMQMLQDLLAGGEFPTGFGGPPAREESREEYSSMYS